MIVAYKASKAVAELLLVAWLVERAFRGTGGMAQTLSGFLREHLASRWSLAAARALGEMSSRSGLHLLEAGLALDATLTAVEGWSLWKGFGWGPWLVASASLLPLPLEVEALVRSFSGVRIAIANVNLAVVVYLGWRIVQRRRLRQAGPRRGTDT